jgi:hypothetical protein
MRSHCLDQACQRNTRRLLVARGPVCGLHGKLQIRHPDGRQLMSSSLLRQLFIATPLLPPDNSTERQYRSLRQYPSEAILALRSLAVLSWTWMSKKHHKTDESCPVMTGLSYRNHDEEKPGRGTESSSAAMVTVPTGILRKSPLDCVRPYYNHNRIRCLMILFHHANTFRIKLLKARGC